MISGHERPHRPDADLVVTVYVHESADVKLKPSGWSMTTSSSKGIEIQAPLGPEGEVHPGRCGQAHCQRPSRSGQKKEALRTQLIKERLYT